MSSRIILSTLLAVLCGADLALAQSYSYSPSPRFATHEGSGVSIQFGSRSESRYQIIDGHLRGLPPLLTAIAFRAGFHRYESTFGQGRSWSSVTVDLSAGNLAAVSSTFSQNIVGTPTRVFSGSVTWPTLDTTRWSGPPAFGYTIPFRAPFVRATGVDLLIDYRLSGGVLANRATWKYEHYYALDTYAYLGTSPITGGSFGYLTAQKNACRDTNGFAAAQMDARFKHYAATAPVGQRNRLFLDTAAAFFGPNTSILVALGFGPNHAGFPLAAIPCQFLYVNPSTPYVVYGLPSGPFGTTSVPVLPATGIPWNPIFAGIEIGLQGFWNDTVTGQPLASIACWSRAPILPEFGRLQNIRREVISAPAATATAGKLLGAGRWLADPLMRYKH